MAACRSCGAAIRFEKSPTSAKLMCLEVDPEGQWVVEGNRAQRFSVLLHTGFARFTSHHATCPDADKWRRGDQ